MNAVKIVVNVLAAAAIWSGAVAADTAPFKNLPRLGETGRLVMGSLQQYPEDMSPDATLFGASISHESWLAAKVHNEQGKMYFAIMQHRRDGMKTGRVMILTPGPNGVLMPDPRLSTTPTEGFASLMGTSAVVSYEEDKGLRLYTAPGTAAIDSLDATITATGFDWKQSGVLDIKATQVSPAAFTYLPWRRGAFSDTQGYVTQEYLAEGTIFGEKVKGFGHLDRSYGRATYFESPFTYLVHGWGSIWITSYDDGTTESGMFLCGSKNYRGAAAGDSRGRETVRSDKINMQSQYENSKLIRADFTIDGEQWEFVPAANGQSGIVFPAFVTLGGRHESFISVYDGTVKRKNDKRKVVGSWAAVETDPAFKCEKR